MLFNRLVGQQLGSLSLLYDRLYSLVTVKQAFGVNSDPAAVPSVNLTRNTTGSLRFTTAHGAPVSGQRGKAPLAAGPSVIGKFKRSG